MAEMTTRRRARIAVRNYLRRRGFELRRYPDPLGSQSEHLAHLVGRAKIDCVLDVGAHRGGYGLTLRELGYRGRIISFEPVRDNAAAIREHLDADWTLVEKGVGNETGMQTMHLTAGSQQHSFLPPNAYADDIGRRIFTVEGTETLEMVRIDDVFAELVGAGARVLLKIDTQGLDLDVLRGATESLGSVEAIQVELAMRQTYEGQPDYLETLAWLREHAFEPSGIFPFYYDPHGWIIEAECFLTRVPPAGA